MFKLSYIAIHFSISPDLFEESKPFKLVVIPYCEENENASNYFVKKFEAFTKSALQNCNKMDNKEGKIIV